MYLEHLKLDSGFFEAFVADLFEAFVHFLNLLRLLDTPGGMSSWQAGENTRLRGVRIFSPLMSSTRSSIKTQAFSRPHG
jgi:hypothetical protein